MGATNPLGLPLVPLRTCLRLQLQHPEQPIVPSTGDEALLLVPGHTLQMRVVGDGDLRQDKIR